MKLFRSTIAVLALTALTGPALAHDVKIGAIEIEHPWARATAPTAQAGIVYLELKNDGETADHLISAASPAATTVQLHTHILDGGTMMMREVKAIDLPPKATVELVPSGLHIMLIGLNKPLVKDEVFPVTLTFEKAGTVTVDVTIEGPGAMGPDEGTDEHKP